MDLPDKKEWEEFKTLNGVDLTYEEFCRLKQEEADHRQIEEERKELIGNMEASTVEESNAKCNVCGSGLLYIENMLYGNRCVFCVKLRYGYKLFDYLAHAYYDRKLYYALYTLAEEDNKMSYIAALGNMGYTDINQIKDWRVKRKLLVTLKNGR